MKIVFIILLIVHGFIHLLGFVKGFGLAEVTQLKENISRPSGAFWLVAAALFIAAASLLVAGLRLWWVPGAAALMISQVLIIISWGDAKFGTIANVIIMVPVVIALAGSLPNSFESRFRKQAEKGLKRYSRRELLTEEDLKRLPLPVREYIRLSGAVGREKLQNFRAVFTGKIKPSPDSGFLDFRSVQYNFFDEPTRLYYIRSKTRGIPFTGLHMYVGAEATMKIKVASLLTVADARGPEMNRGETVTMFNDMCCFAPAALIDENIRWEEVDSLTVKAEFTNSGNTISATLFFNESRELVDFASDDRYESADGKEFKSYRWTTPVGEYRDFGGRRVASYGEAIWHKPSGEYCYGKFRLVEIEYNLEEYK